ncbi:MAG: glycosyltransferase family 4 protein [Oscillospiraceae bacterium]|nr:glycosyltransferase family 4 protein [Oscillospiraceae bacterium]
MKILIDLTSLADNFSGIERFAMNMALQMTENRAHSYVLVFKNAVHEAFFQTVQQDHVEALVLKGGHKLVFNQLILPLKLYRQKADVYFFPAFPEPVLFFRKHTVTTIHDLGCWDCGENMTTLSKWYFRISYRKSMRLCEKLITVSEFSKGRIIALGRVPAGKIEVIYNGVSEAFFSGKAPGEAVRQKYQLPQQYLLCLSTLEPRKNLQLLVKAYESLILEGHDLPPLVLAGRKGWKMDGLLEGIDPAVVAKLHFTGFIDDEDLPAIYAGARLFVFPSKYEGFGIPPLEAMAAGCPVLSSDAASLPEVLGNAASYFESENPDSLKTALLSVLERPRTEGLQAQAEHFAWSAEAEKLLSCL